MAKSQHLGDPVIPVEVLGVNVEQVAASQRPPRRVQNVQALMDKLAQLTEALVYRAHVGWLLGAALQRRTWGGRSASVQDP